METLSIRFANAPELYAHAIEIEREAAVRYLELGERMRDLGNDSVGELFLRLAALEREHEKELVEHAAGLRLPNIPAGDHAWIDTEVPQVGSHELVMRLITARSALQIALDAERRAKAFFESATKEAQDPELAALAAAMVAEEREHVRWVEQLMARTPDSAPDWDQLFCNV